MKVDYDFSPFEPIEVNQKTLMRDLYRQWKAMVLHIVRNNPEKTYLEIAQEFGVTPQYIGDIARRAGITRRSKQSTTATINKETK